MTRYCQRIYRDMWWAVRKIRAETLPRYSSRDKAPEILTKPCRNLVRLINLQR